MSSIYDSVAKVSFPQKPMFINISIHAQILDDAPDSDTFVKPEGYPLQDGDIYILNENGNTDAEKVYWDIKYCS